MAIKSLLMLAICTITASFACAQNSTCNLALHGRVRDLDTEEALPFASIFLTESKTGQQCDARGEFTFTGLCPGTYTLVCRYLGYDSTVTRVNVRGSQHIDVSLHQSATHLETVEVKGKAAQAVTTLSTSALTSEQVEAGKGGNLGEALQQISGVSLINTGPSISKPMIHGMYGQRILLLNNGIRQEGQQWGQEHAPEIDLFQAGSLSVVKGAASVRYGADAIGGAIQVEAAELPNTPGIKGQVYVVGNTNGRQGNTSLQLEGQPKAHPAWSWRTQVSGKKAGDLKTPGYYLTNTGSEELNGSLQLRHRTATTTTQFLASSFNTRLGIYAGAHIGNLADLLRVIESGKPMIDKPFSYEISAPHQQVRHQLYSLKSAVQFTNIGLLQVQYGYQRNSRMEFDRHLGDGTGKVTAPDFDLALHTHTAEILLNHQPLGKLSGSFGLNGMHQTNVAEGRRFLVPNYRATNAGAFLIERLNIGKVTLEAGIRYDWRFQRAYLYERGFVVSPEFNYQQLSGTGGISYEPNHHWLLKLNAGTAWRPPSINELFSRGLHHGTASFEIGDRNLDAEQSQNVSGSVAFNYSRFSLEMQPYVQWFKGYIYTQPLIEPIVTIAGVFPAFAYKKTDARFAGVDVTGSFAPFENWEINATSAVVYARDLSNKTYLPYIPPARFTAGINRTFSSRGIFQNPSIRISETYVAQQGRYVAGSDYLAPPPAYSLLKLEAGTSLKAGRQLWWLQLSVNNALNNRYRDYLNRFRYFSDELGRSYVLRLKIPFGTVTD